MNLLVATRLALIARVQQITTENGYRTNLGHQVRTGWLNEVLESKDLPETLAVIQRAKGRQPAPGPAAWMLPKGFFVVGLANVGMDNYEEALDDMELDIVRALLPTEGQFLKWLPRGCKSISLGEPESFPPGKGLLHAGVLVPIYIHTIIQENT